MTCDSGSPELWKPVPHYEGLYEVSNLGRIRSHHRRGCVRKPGRDQTGYPIVVFYKGETKPWPVTIHRVVAETFVAGRSALHCEVAHLDGDMENCRADNLKWVSKVENESHKRRHGTRLVGERCPYAKHTEEEIAKLARLLVKGVGATEAARLAGVSYSTARDVERGHRWRHAMAQARQASPNLHRETPMPDNKLTCTDEMIEAGVKALHRYALVTSPQNAAKFIYTAMHSARPIPTGYEELRERLRSVDISWSEAGEWCAEAADAITTLLTKLAEVERAATKARDKFREYEQLHRLKNTPEGTAKAKRNSEMADMLTKALGSIR